MVKNFTDKDGSKYDFTLRGKYAQSIRSEAKLKKVLDDSVSVEALTKQYPHLSADRVELLANAYAKHTYRRIMSDFGMLSHAVLIQKGR